MFCSNQSFRCSCFRQVLFTFCRQMFNERASSIVETLKKANSILPHVVLASTVLALLYPPSFTWFTSRFSSLYTS